MLLQRLLLILKVTVGAGLRNLHLIFITALRLYFLEILFKQLINFSEGPSPT